MKKPTLFHGTNHQFNVGDFITPANEHGGAINYSTRYLKQLKYFAYATIYISEAESYADHAALTNGGTQYIYLVQPFDEKTLFHDDDAPYPDWHVDSVDGWSSGAYKTRDGFEVIAIVKQGGIEMQLEDPAIKALYLELISTDKNVNEREKAMKALKSPEATPEEMIEVFKLPEEREKMKSPDEMTAYQIIDSIYRANDIYNDGGGFDARKVGTIERWDRYGYYTRHMRQFEQADNGSCVGQWSMMYETRLIQTNTGWMMQTSVTSCYIADKDVDTKLTTRRNSKTGEMKNSSIPAHRRNFNHIMIVTNSPSGVRILVKDTKTKAVKWGQFLSDQKEFGKLHAAEISHISRHIYKTLEEIYSQKDVMPITEYLPKEVDAEYTLNYNEKLQLKQLHGFTARNMYWIGGRTSLVEILNRAYGKTGQEGLTRNAFGGMKTFKHFQELEAAIILVRMFKLFPREFFDNLDISWVVADKTTIDKNYDGNRYQIDRILNVATEDIDDFNKFFKTFGFRNSTIKWYQGFFAQTNGDTMHQVRIVSDTMASWKNIPLGNARKTLVSYVKQQKMNPLEIHDFVVAEAQKYAQAERKTPNTKLINQFSEKEILPGVIFVAPKTTHDLIDWGASQANCIGTAYSIRVANRDCYIVGFKDKATNQWIGHARLTKDYHLEELLGKHNRSLESTMNANICKWMKQNLTNTKKEIK